jgi:hypothetical protein
MRKIRTREAFVDEISYVEGALRYLIRNAFLIFLKREPDAAAYSFYLERLQKRAMTRKVFVATIAAMAGTTPPNDDKPAKAPQTESQKESPNLYLGLASDGRVPKLGLRFSAADAKFKNLTYRYKFLQRDLDPPADKAPSLESIRSTVMLNFDHNGKKCSFEGIVGWQEIEVKPSCK